MKNSPLELGIYLEPYTSPSLKEKIKAILNSIYGTECLKRKEIKNMSKFNIGDKVKIKKDLVSGKSYNGVGFAGSMCKYMGEVATIEHVDSDGDYKLDIDNRLHYWSDGMLEPFKVFTKSDLKDGMVVEYRNGNRALVIAGRFLDVDGWMGFDDYDSELLRTFSLSVSKPWDIVKCYEVKSDTGLCMLKNLFEDRYLTLLWEREEEPDYKEMTVEEIEEKLGYKVKVIGEKE